MRACVAILVLLAFTVSVSRADAPVLRVIVHPKAAATRVDRKFVTDAFLKKRTRWGDDQVIRPVDLGASSAVRRRFSDDILGRSIDAVRRYWNQQVFSGRGVPPPQVGDEAAVVEYVLTHPGAIGYVTAGTDVRGAKVVMER
jgi:ABC-type phosphate transport system substrate-binding protein